MKRRLMLKLAVGVLLVLIATSVWLGATESGLNTVLGLVQKYVPELTVEQASGRLSSNISLKNISYDSGADNVISIDEFDLSWHLNALFSGRLVIDSAVVNGVAIKASEQADDNRSESIVLPDIIFPLPIDINLVHVSDVTMVNQDNDRVELLSRLESTLRLNKNNVSIDRLLVEHAEADSLTLQGNVQLSGIYPTDISYRVEYDVPEFKRVVAVGEIKGDIKHLTLLQQSIQPVESTQKISLNDVINKLNWQANIKVPVLNIADFFPEQAGLFEHLELQAEGDLTNAQALLTSQLRHSQLPLVNIAINAKSDSFDSWNVDTTITSPKEMAVRLAGTMTEVMTQPTVAMTLDWTQLLWPMTAEPTLVASPKGQLTLVGNANQFKLNVSAELDAQSQQGLLTLDAEGNSSRIAIKQLELAGLGGKTQFIGELSVDSVTSVNGELYLDKLNPAVMAEDWPGELSGHLAIMASLTEQTRDVTVNDMLINGSLRQRPFKLQGALSYINKQLNISDLQLSSAKSTIKMEGVMHDSIAIDWQLNSPDLSDFYPDIAGVLSASGTVSGKPNLPAIAAQLEGSNIAYADNVTIAKVKSDIKLDMSQNNLLDATADLFGTDIDSVKGINGQFSVSGNEQNHQFGFEISSKEINVLGKLKGSFKEEVWQGAFEKLTFKLPERDVWTLAEAGQVSLAKDAVSLQQQCLTSDESQLCLNADYSREQWAAKGQFDKLPLALFHRFSEELKPLTGMLNGRFNLSGRGNYPTVGDGDIRIDNGYIDLTKSELDSERVIELTEAKLHYQLSKDKTEIAVVVTPKLEGVSRVTGELITAGSETLITSPQKAALTGSFKTAIKDLSVFDALTADYEKLQGELNANIELSGSVAKPLAKGSISINNASVDVTRVGLTLNDVNASLEGDLDQGFKLNYQASSGKGKLAGDALISFNDKAWQVDSHIKGDNFEVVNLSEAYVLASPDLNIKMTPKAMYIDGSVLIPEAELEPVALNSPVPASKDVVIVNSDSNPEQDSYPAIINVNLALGEAVKLKALGFTGRLAGNLLASGNTNEVLRGKGTILIKDGVYNAYGKKLTIDNGKINFSGGPIERPSLDIKAIKIGKEYSVGLHIVGLVDEPELNLFSTPDMSDDEIISYLVLGRPLSEATVADAAILASAAAGFGGNGDGIAQTLGLDSLAINGEGKDDAALELGKNLSPNLFIGYGIGIFDSVNTVNLRYKLSKIWTLKAESGKETGVDLLYTYER